MSKYAKTPRLAVAVTLALAAWCAQAQDTPAPAASAPQESARPPVGQALPRLAARRVLAGLAALNLVQRVSGIRGVPDTTRTVSWPG